MAAGTLTELLARAEEALDDDNIIERVYELTRLINRRILKGSLNVSIHTADLLYKVVQHSQVPSVVHLMNQIRAVGRVLVHSAPHELTLANIVRRVLFIIGVEHAAYLEGDGKDQDEYEKYDVEIGLSLHRLDRLDLDDEAYQIGLDELKSPILSEIDIVIKDLHRVYMNISDQAIEHIHASEIILTFGRSQTVLSFMEEASKKRQFKVFVAESAPSYTGHPMAEELAKRGIDSTVISDSAVFAVMSRVNKVIVGTHAVLHNGGLLAHNGAYNIAAAAKYHRVPFVCVTGLYKLSPQFAFDQDTLNEHGNPVEVLPYDEGCLDFLEIENPLFDYIPPEYVGLFVTNMGEHPPSYIYRLLHENYRVEDYNF